MIKKENKVTYMNESINFFIMVFERKVRDEDWQDKDWRDFIKGSFYVNDNNRKIQWCLF